MPARAALTHGWWTLRMLYPPAALLIGLPVAVFFGFASDGDMDVAIGVGLLTLSASAWPIVAANSMPQLAGSHPHQRRGERRRLRHSLDALGRRECTSLRSTSFVCYRSRSSPSII